ncbi:CheR family methyltransferase [Sulfitobacter guttiformis]|uniref:Chemotaxis protein methyltransferase n=1 Tax=Sulfitobacter guttiformis TaxID=74349 RepID=A0A420DH36_9RHOB|nr:CheR family methyltransferase [Sulfitobacter guttiformis]KIN72748.1 Chemotaxis protein methyltransferase [Sulfitobacter guttiformis KCTC 32187]RKE93538.1 chemotaxis protein methyltransferase CheR [Sulfitobacter guttiformis]
MNIRAHAGASETPPELSTADFEAIANFALREFGLSLPASKTQLVKSRLARRLRALNLPNFAAYRSLLEGPNGQAERNELLSSLTTNVTKFFREIHHFEDLLRDVMPQLVARACQGERVRIWSAGCSSGQEPYSIALTALKCHPDIATKNFKILATDIDPSIIVKAREATYRDDEIAAVDKKIFRVSDIVRSVQVKEGCFTVSKDVRSLVTFGVLNLIEELPFNGAFNVIFCRNVAIYFNRETQQSVWSRFSSLLPSGGKLFIGHSERIMRADQPKLEPCGVTVYKKL